MRFVFAFMHMYISLCPCLSLEVAWYHVYLPRVLSLDIMAADSVVIVIICQEKTVGNCKKSCWVLARSIFVYSFRASSTIVHFRSWVSAISVAFADASKTHSPDDFFSAVVYCTSLPEFQEECSSSSTTVLHCPTFLQVPASCVGCSFLWRLRSSHYILLPSVSLKSYPLPRA